MNAPHLYRGRETLTRRIAGLFARACDLLGKWHERHRSRAHLAQLDPRMLANIGADSADVEIELRKPLWRA